MQDSSGDQDETVGDVDRDTWNGLTDRPEDQWFERKSSRIAPKDLARALVAFANAEGGTLAVGFHSGRFDGERLTAA